MPFYEYYCPDNHTLYTFFARSLAVANKIPRCPDNPDFPMEKRLSRFAITGKTREKTGGADSGDLDLDNPRLEKALASMENDFSSLDEANPDPRQLGNLMRRMSEVMGAKLPPSVEEMVGRLEKGEDPEKLDEEYGDLIDEEFENAESGRPASTTRAALRLLRRQPRRDPVVYDLADYI